MTILYRLRRLQTPERVSVGLVVVSMVLFPVGALGDRVLLSTVGIVCVACGALIGAIFDLQRQRKV